MKPTKHLSGKITKKQPYTYYGRLTSSLIYIDCVFVDLHTSAVDRFVSATARSHWNLPS